MANQRSMLDRCIDLPDLAIFQLACCRSNLVC